MTTPLTKLIEENKWMPIAEAPEEITRILATDGREVQVIDWGKDWCSHGCYTPTHFRPLPDDRLAKCFEILLNAALSAKEQNHIYEAAADIETALQEITAIAEGKDNA